MQERFAETRQAFGNRTDAGPGSSGNRTFDAPKIDEQTKEDRANELNAQRKQVVAAELDKRKDAAKYIYWNLRIKLPEAVAEDCREKYKEDGDDGKAYWVRAAYRYVGREDELESGSDAVQENGSSDE